MKKEIIGYGLAVIALIGCCLLLSTLLVGGTLAFLGSYLKQKWLSFVGLAILIFAVISVIIYKKRKLDK